MATGLNAEADSGDETETEPMFTTIDSLRTTNSELYERYAAVIDYHFRRGPAVIMTVMEAQGLIIELQGALGMNNYNKIKYTLNRALLKICSCEA